VRPAWDSLTRYKFLLDLNNAIVSQTTREELFRSVAGEIHKVLLYDRFSISIYDSKKQSLSWFAIADGITVKDMDDTPRSLEKGPVARAVITSRQPLIIPDMSAYSHWDTVRMMMAAGLKATLAFPLIIRGQVVGSLHFSFKSTPADIDEMTGFLAELSGQVALAVDNMLAHSKLVDKNRSLEQQKRYLLGHVDSQYDPSDFFYCSPVMQELMREVCMVAESDASVLITGETGTGKDYIARYIHHFSARSDALFVKVNCPGLAENLFESELFGHAKGAFTGANTKRIGRFEMANGGTVFLDEVGELSPQLQAKLLQILQDRRFERVGESRPIDINFRVIAATNANLEDAIREKRFRSDLFYRLNTVCFHIPALRERVDEIEPLIERLTRTQSQSMHRSTPLFSPHAIELLKQHSWPGNIRELKNIVSRLVILYSGKTVTRRDIEPLLGIKPAAETGPAATLSDMERDHLAKVLTMTRGVIGGPNGAAVYLKLPKSTVQYKVRKHGLNPRDYF
jgi:transcriptional regulator with GAF, ATPase, and Fis domain